MLEDACPACGILFRKFLTRGVAPAAQQTAAIGESGSGVLAWLAERLETPEEGRDARGIAGAVLLVLGAWYAWQFFRADISDPGTLPLGFLHAAMVPFHEVGHMVFRPFGEFMHLAGGSLAQFLMPIAFGVYFVHWRRDNLAGWLMLWWEGSQWVDLAPYAYDAYEPKMILLTGRTGDTGAHDYVDMLADLGLLHRAHAVGAVMQYFGVLLMVVALAWGALLLVRIWQDRSDA